MMNEPQKTDRHRMYLGGAIGFWFGAFILAKLPSFYDQGFVRYMSSVENAAQGLAMIGLCLLFGITFGALFDRPSHPEDNPQDNEGGGDVQEDV